MVVDFEKQASIQPDNYDVCIIGAGAAGIVLATSLAQRGVRTLLLEAGGKRYASKYQDSYLGESDGLPYGGLYEGRFRVLGGTTTQWGGQILELDDFIFEKRPWIPGSGWPFSKAELTPYYRRALQMEGLSQSPGDTEEIWRGLGLQQPAFGQDLLSAFAKFCPNTNFVGIHNDALFNDPNLTLCIRATAVELELADDQSTVVGVLCRSIGGREMRFGARNFVICMGGIENSRFLLQATRRGSVAPWNRYGMVGRHFQDHLSGHVADVVEQNSDLPDVYLDYVSIGGYRFQQKMKLSFGTQKQLETLDVAGFLTHFSGNHDDMALAYETVRWLRTNRYEKLSFGRLAHLAFNIHKMVWHRMPYSRAMQSGTRASRRKLKLCVNCEQSPLSEGRISLSPQQDSLGLWRAKVHWRSSAQEIHSIRSYVAIIQKSFEENRLGKIVPFPSLSSDEAVNSSFTDIFHHLGGTRMAETPDAGVVDPNLRIFGTTNAYVCSTSVFPSAGFANPTHTLIALAYRLADHLRTNVVSGTDRATLSFNRSGSQSETENSAGI